jgi:hypothetical protein
VRSIRQTGSADARERWQLASLLAAIGLLMVASLLVGPSWVPPTVFAIPLLLGGLLLRIRAMLLLVVVVVGALVVELLADGLRDFRPGNVVLYAVIGALSVRLAVTRESSGLPGLRGEGMLVDLRDRLQRQGEVPPLPPGWRIEVVQRSAGGGSFGGDFVVSALSPRRDFLELALVDVSGKGVAAATRALQLAGALGGLLGAVPPEQFLSAANAYLDRQDWDEGFATAVHVAVDLRTGAYLLESAGHPPAAHFAAGSGQWQQSRASGSILGFLPQSSWEGERGVLNPGDALLLYTDGCVEVPGRDLGVGVDYLLGQANRLVVTTFTGGAQRLVDAVAPQSDDDRALILLWRT